MFIIPIVVSVVNIMLLVCVYPYDTPPILKMRGDYQRLNEFMGKLYQPYIVQSKIDEINAGGLDTTDADMTQNLSYKEVFTGPLYRKATFIGCSLAIFQQLTGINVIMFYSTKIFQKANLSLSAQSITGLVGGVNFITTFGGLILLSLAGRRTIMLWCNVLMAIVLVCLGFCSLEEQKILEIVLLLSFIALFEFSSGPITWLYMSEIMQDKALTVATFLNWIINLIISATIPSII